jgi:type IV pilus assembly protein PilP
MKKWIFLIPVVLAACTAEQDDLRSWMAQQEAGMKGQVKPLPEIKPFPVVDYDAFTQINPYDADKFVAARVVVGGGRAPDANRQREPLESYPLESLKRVGVLQYLSSPLGELHGPEFWRCDQHFGVRSDADGTG